ncbi:hypothetical protein [Microbacterium sp. gxy059]|uniref:hypothetical protein n=1 Tax=Microbacterium sp. gxy059 TaxID=2957199 RepID=UPI003D96F96A
MSRNAIAKEIGYSGATVTNVAKALGLSFDRSSTEAAVKAHRVDLAESRQLLAEKMMREAHAMLDALSQPYEVFNFGGKDNTFNSHTFDTPPVEVKRNVLTTAGIAFDKATRIVEKAPEEDVTAEVKAAIAGFTAGLDHLFEGDTYGQVADAGDGDGDGNGGAGT